jgi:outer membrane protein OmpA-like peptidoglycan-associated protein
MNFSTRIGTPLLAGLIALPTNVAAQPSQTPAEGPSAGASGSVSLTPAGVDSSGSADANKPKPKKKKSDSGDKPMRKYRPSNNMWELGVFGGAFFPSRRHELFNAQQQLDSMDTFYQDYKRVAPEFGARVAYFPFAFIGGEIEGGVMPTRTIQQDQQALLFNFRAHLIGQIPFWRIAPFVVWGGGLIGTTGALGNDVDESTHFGGGVKFYINDLLMLRLDIRDVVAARYRVDAGATNYPEVLLGLSFTLRKKRKEEPKKDSDGDGFLDAEDACPYEPGIAPDGCPEGDRDGDGFLDGVDKCPDTPGIAPDGCPEKDRDGDGILDSVDKCPDTPGVPEYEGCPIPDRDGDGILDPNDKCPDDPETYNGFEDDDGCPDEIPEQVRNYTGVIRGIYFDLDKDTIKPKSKPVLDRAVDVLKEFPSIRLEISGHTDNTGTREYNLDLSRRRSESVKRYLMEAGVEESRIQTRGAGPDEPIDTNKTAAGRAKNRRIEFTILVQ